MSSVCIYLVVFFLSARLLSNYHKNSRFCICIGLLIPIVFAAGRYRVGTDFVTYVNMFERYVKIPWKQYLEFLFKGESLFLLMCRFFYPIGGRVIIFGIMAASSIILTYKTLRKQYPNIALGTSIAVFLFSAFAGSFNVSRQYVAVAIIFSGIQYIFDDKLKEYLICIVIAALFHKSAVIAVVMWFLWDHGKSCAIIGKRRFFLLFMLLIAVLEYREVIIFVGNNISFFSKYVGFANDYQGTVSNRDFYLSLFQLIVILILSKVIKVKDSRIDFMITIMIIAQIIGITGFWQPHIKRVAYYFQMPAELVICGYLPTCVKERQKVIMSGLVVFYFVAKFILTAYILGQGHLIPYTFDLTANLYSN